MCDFMFSLSISQIHLQLISLNPSKMEKTSSSRKLQSFHVNKNQFLLVAFICSLLCYCLSCFLRFPNSLTTSLLTPKCLFIVVNIIVVFLVGESKLSGSNSSVSPSQIYDEYVERSRHFRTSTTLQQQTKPFIDASTSQDKEVIEWPQEEVKEVQEVVQVEEKSEEKEAEMEETKTAVELENEEDKGSCIEEESECGMATEELNRRVEEFIARVNKQRWLEAKFLVCCEA